MVFAQDAKHHHARREERGEGDNLASLGLEEI
jgi:hypothetical protein